MFRPVNQRIPIIFGIALINTFLFYWVSISTVPKYNIGYMKKIEAAQIMKESLDIIKIYQHNREDYIIDIEDDPFESGIIGPATSLITTSLSNLRSKQTTVNPNMAAMVVTRANAIKSTTTTSQ